MNSNGHIGPEVRRVLGDIGLSDAESAVYLAALELGSRPASVIAHKAGLKRGQTYNVLANLIQMGIVQEFVRSSVRHFTSSPPHALVGIVDKKEEELRRNKQKLQGVIPDLERVCSNLLVKPKVRFYQGIEGMLEVFEDTIRVPNLALYGLIDLEYSIRLGSEETKEWVQSYMHRRDQNNNWYLGIICRDENPGTEFKLVPAVKRRLKYATGLRVPAEIIVYGSKVAIFSSHDERVAIIIESEPIAETLRNIHQTVWNFLPDYQFVNSQNDAPETEAGLRVSARG